MATSSSSSQEPLVPSINFAMVCPGVYRSGYPTRKNYAFLRALRLRSVLYLCPEDYAESNLKFCEANNIAVLRFPTEGNKEPFNDISEPLMHRILSALCDTRNMPVLVHCNKGKHRTGTVVAALRLLHDWSLVSIFEEYKRFAGDKARVSDQQYVELYNPVVRVTPPHVASWLRITPRITIVLTEYELQEAEARQLGYSLLAPEPVIASSANNNINSANNIYPSSQFTLSASASASVTHANSSVPVAGAPGGLADERSSIKSHRPHSSLGVSTSPADSNHLAPPNTSPTLRPVMTEDVHGGSTREDTC